MRGQVDNIDWAFAAQKEKEFRHDVMGHIHAFGHVCPKVRNENIAVTGEHILMIRSNFG